MYIQSDLSYPASLYPDLSIIRTRSRQDFFLCVYNNYGEKGEFQSSQEFLQQNDFILLKTRL